MLPKTRKTQVIRPKVTVWIIRSVIFVFLFSLFSLGIHHLTSVVYAQSEIPTENVDDFGVAQVGQNINVATPANADLRVLIVRIINVVLGFLGIVVVGIVLYAGYLWMTSQGNEEVVAAAKKMLVNATIGLVIIISAYTITTFILRSLLAAINGTGGNTDSAPVFHTYTFSGSLGSVIKDHYPKRDQREIPRNTSIVITFGVPVNPATIIENSNRTCWNPDRTGASTQCTTTSGGIVGPETPLESIANPYYGDCTDLDRDGVTSMKTECDQLIVKNVIIDEQTKFSAQTITDGTIGVQASALTTYDSDRNSFTFVFRPHEYLGSSTEDVTYRVRLGTSLMRADTNKSVFENQFSEGYQWDFTTGNFLDLTPPQVIEVYPEESTSVAKNSIIQITFNEPIDPTTVESVVNETTNSSFVLLNQTVDSSATFATGSWRLSNGYRVLEFTPATPCGVNSCGETMFCLNVQCTGASCKSPFGGLLRTAEWTQNAEAPYEAVPFSGIYDLAFNGLDNASDNEARTHLIKPTASTGLLILSGEKAPDNYWWNFEVENRIDRSRPYIEETLPGVDAEDVAGDAHTYLQFSSKMWAKTLENISLEEYPTNVCADAALPPADRAPSNSCERLDTLWYRVESVTRDKKTRTYLEHREFGPNSLDLYYIPTVPSTVKNLSQNCAYPGFGPWAPESVLPSVPSNCNIEYDDANGTVLSQAGCVGVVEEAQGDTGCVYTLGSGSGGDENNPIFRAGTVSECVSRIHTQSPSSY